MWLDLDAVIGGAAGSLAASSIQGAAAIALIWIAIRLLPNVPPSLQTTLWWLALLKLLLALMPLPTVPIPILPAEVEMRGSIAGGTTVSAPSAASARAPSIARQQPVAASWSGAAGPRAWLLLLVGVWLAGVVLHGTRLVAGLRTLRGIVRRAGPAEADDQALVARLTGVMGLRHPPRLLVSDEIDTPQVAGIVQPTVLLPRRGVALSSDERAMALCHELVHLQRRDLVLGWVPVIAERLFFFHPFARLAAREYLTAREAACDAAVVRALRVSATDYGRLLFRQGVARPLPAFAARSAAGSSSSLRRRLQMLQHVHSSRISRRSAAFIVGVVLAATIPFQLVAREPLAPAFPGDVRGANGGRARDVTLPPIVPERIALTGVADGQSEARLALEQERAGDRRVQEVERETVAAREAAERLKAELEQRRAEMEAVFREAERDQVGRARLAEMEALRHDARFQEFHRRLQLEELNLRQARLAEEEALARAHGESQLSESARLLEERLHLIRLELERVRNTQDAARETEWRLRHIRRADRSPRVYARGELVALTPAEDGTRPPDATVLAVPGDHVRVSRAGILVNGTPVTGVSAAFLAGLPEDAWEQVLPADHYFVAAEQQAALHAMRFWGVVAAVRLGGAR